MASNREVAALLQNVLKIFRENRSGPEILDALTIQEIIHPSFETRYLAHSVDFDFEVRSMEMPGKNEYIFFLEAGDGSPYRAVFIYEGKWYLKSFLFQCQGCFGDDDTCLVCGGEGWGVL
ncbi:hypothetical protein [Taibaiella chishuiensis]|uniref:hypothetical protein n=1 Tax=Taibaiella chishuiensis TaxID=1434707 RepID=UPI0015E713A6|nr:hypothetical protein [Taibaiella chishuiensis]